MGRWSGAVGGKKDSRRCEGGEEEDEDEEELKEDSPEGPGVVLEELRFEVGEEEMS